MTMERVLADQTRAHWFILIGYMMGLPDDDRAAVLELLPDCENGHGKDAAPELAPQLLSAMKLKQNDRIVEVLRRWGFDTSCGRMPAPSIKILWEDFQQRKIAGMKTRIEFMRDAEDVAKACTEITLFARKCEESKQHALEWGRPVEDQAKK